MGRKEQRGAKKKLGNPAKALSHNSICVHLSRFSKGEKGSHPFSFRIRTTNREMVKKSMIEKKSQRISNNVRNKIKHDFKFFPKRKSTARNHHAFDCRGKNDFAL